MFFRVQLGCCVELTLHPSPPPLSLPLIPLSLRSPPPPAQLGIPSLLRQTLTHWQSSTGSGLLLSPKLEQLLFAISIQLTLYNFLSFGLFFEFLGSLLALCLQFRYERDWYKNQAHFFGRLGLGSKIQLCFIFLKLCYLLPSSPSPTRHTWRGEWGGRGRGERESEERGERLSNVHDHILIGWCIHCKTWARKSKHF